MIRRWRELMDSGIPAGSQAREPAEIRAYLLGEGLFREVYR
jgi:hypothetical protein